VLKSKIVIGIVTNPLNPELLQILFKNSARTAKKTPHFTITKINWLTLFKVFTLKMIRNTLKDAE
jgi:hypothetical protein